jgi:hypothetical protein
MGRWPSAYAGLQTLCGSMTCYYGATSLSYGFDNPSGSTAQWQQSQTLSKESGSGFSCAAAGTASATYEVVTDPGGATLYVTP